MKTLTHSQLVSLLEKTNGARPVGLLAVTDAKARKTGNPYGAIFKTVRAVGFVGADYGASVRREGVGRQAAFEADAFKADSLPWGAWAVAGKVIVHKGAFYLRTQSTPGQRKRQPARVLGYTNEAGQRVEREAIAPFLPAPSKSAKQQACGMGETVDVRTYAFSSIRRVRVNGHTFKLVAD